MSDREAKHVWGLVDERTGHPGQALGVIAKLGAPYAMKRLEFNTLAKLPDHLLGATLLSLNRAHSAPIEPPWPKLVIAAGRRTLPVLRYIKKKSPDTKTTYLLWPEMQRGIDLIAVPEHDEPPVRDHIVTTIAPLHAITPETLRVSRDAWESHFAHLPKPWIGVCLGGNTRHGHYTVADWRELLTQATKLAGPGSLLVTTSQRTPPEAAKLFEALLQGPHLLHHFHVDKDNPYLGILGCSDAIIVTGDSLSMCAEACVSGKPVFIFTTPKVTLERHAKFHARLYTRGMARPLNKDAALDWQPAAAMDDAAHIAAEIRARFPQALT